MTSEDGRHGEEDAHWLARYVRHGAPDDASFRHQVLGFYLHWRTWAIVGTVALPYVVGMAAYTHLGHYWGLLVGIFVALLAGGWALRVGTKYTVTKNY